jgi:uncharacterized protein (DUF2062 family)
MPRRAMLHRYPFIGRFAPQLRDRSYLWSFRRNHVRRACYSGSVLALLPLFGVQLPLSLILALVLRTNFMVLGGLQFITNPVTAAPIYYATHQIGSGVLATLSGRSATAEVPSDEELVQMGTFVAESIVEPLGHPPAISAKPRARIRDGLYAMIVGGAVLGLTLGAALDLLDGLLRHRARRRATAPSG